MLTGADRFTASRLQTALIESGLPLKTFTVRDFAWADEMLEQRKNIWQLAGVFSIICILVRCCLVLLRTEYQRRSKELQTNYLTDYLRENSVRMLTEIIFLTLGVFVGFAALKWLWEINLTLPTVFLLDESIFDIKHYRLWLENTFPPDGMSDYGRELCKELKDMYQYACAVSTMLLATGLIPFEYVLKKRISLLR